MAAQRTQKSRADSDKTMMVFETFELMEAILLYLPFDDLFVAQRSTRAFYNTVRGSKPLQQNLYLLPPPENAAADHVPVLSTPFCPPEARSNNFVQLYVSGTPIMPSMLGNYFRYQGMPVRVMLTGVNNLPRVGTRCRDMLLCHPPVHKLTARSPFFRPRSAAYPTGARAPKEIVAATEAGITVGQLLDAVEQWREMGGLVLGTPGGAYISRADGLGELLREMGDGAQLWLDGWVELARSI